MSSKVILLNSAVKRRFDDSARELRIAKSIRNKMVVRSLV